MRDPVPDDILNTQQTGGMRDAVPEDILGPSEKKIPQPAPDLTASQDDLTWREAIWRGFTNIPGSGMQFGKDIFQAARHPVQTAGALGKVVGGFGEKLIPGEHPYEEYADLFVDFMKNRYGSVENFKRAVSEDPVGVFADAASIFIAGGTAVRTVGATTKLGKVAKAGTVVSRLGAATEPLNLTMRVAAIPFKLPAVRKAANRMYQSAAKFSTTLNEAQRIKVAQTAMDLEMRLGLSGWNKLFDELTEVNNRIAQMIDAAQVTGPKMPIEELYKHIGELKKKYKGSTLLAADAWDEIDATVARVKLSMKGRKALTPKRAQTLKQGTYKDLKRFYEKQGNHPAGIETQKAIARSIKEYLEEVIPEIKQLNAYDGDLLELQKAIDRPISRIRNRDLWGLGSAVKTGLGSAAGGLVAGKTGAGIGAGAGLLFATLDTPHVKSALAVFMNRLNRRGIRVRMTPTLARLLARGGAQIEVTP